MNMMVVMDRPTRKYYNKNILQVRPQKGQICVVLCEPRLRKCKVNCNIYKILAWSKIVVLKIDYEKIKISYFIEISVDEPLLY